MYCRHSPCGLMNIAARCVDRLTKEEPYFVAGYGRPEGRGLRRVQSPRKRGPDSLKNMFRVKCGYMKQGNHAHTNEKDAEEEMGYDLSSMSICHRMRTCRSSWKVMVPGRGNIT